MKFTRQEKIITTISSVNLSDSDEIKSLLIDIKKEHLRFALTVRNTFYNGESTQVYYPNATVKKINENNIDFFIFNKSGSIQMKVSLENIIEIAALTNKNDFLKYGKPITKFDVMDL